MSRDGVSSRPGVAARDVTSPFARGADSCRCCVHALTERRVPIELDRSWGVSSGFRLRYALRRSFDIPKALSFHPFHNLSRSSNM